MAHEAIDYPALAGELSLTEGAVRVAVHRMRKRFREMYRREVAQTLPEGADLDDEVRCLAESLARG
jgi:RNA polymerase sigma-70 factor (ECF subfamily)